MRELYQQWLCRIGKQHCAVLAILLSHANGRRFIPIHAEHLGMSCIQASGMPFSRIEQMHSATVTHTKSMGMQQRREALQQRQQNEENKSGPSGSHALILNLI